MFLPLNYQHLLFISVIIYIEAFEDFEFNCL
jgi:hypothetical protein